MQLIDTLGRCSLEITHHLDPAVGYDAFSFRARVDIGHGAFQAVNKDIQFLDLPDFVSRLESFIHDRSVTPRLNGTYDSFLMLSGTVSRVGVDFSLADEFTGYGTGCTPFVFTGAFETEPDRLHALLAQSRELLESWYVCHPA